MLLAALPGIRDLRTPLCVGSSFLAAFVILFIEFIPTSIQAATGSLRSLYELLGLLGGPISLGALAFIAYIIGVVTAGIGTSTLRLLRSIKGLLRRATSKVSHIDSPDDLFDPLNEMLFRRISAGYDWAGFLFAYRFVYGDTDLSGFIVAEGGLGLGIREPEISAGNLSKIGDGSSESQTLLAYMHDKVQSIGDVLATAPIAQRVLLHALVRMDYYRGKFATSIRQLPSRLIVEQPAVFERWDRLQSEAEFRVGMATPVLAVGAACAYQAHSSGWTIRAIILVGSFAVWILLLRSGLEKEGEANRQLVESLTSAHVNDDALDDVGRSVIAWVRTGVMAQLQQGMTNRTPEELAAFFIVKNTDNPRGEHKTSGSTKAR